MMSKDARIELDLQPLKIAACFIATSGVIQLLDLLFLHLTGFTGHPGYFYLQAVIAFILAIFVYFGFKWAWGLAFILYGYLIYRDISDMILLLPSWEKWNSMVDIVVIFVVIRLILQIGAVVLLFLSRYRATKTAFSAS